MNSFKVVVWTMEFPERLASLRKEKGITQHKLAEQVGIHVIQIRRYEAGTSQPTLDVIRRLAIALQVSTDMLIFGENGRGPDDDLRLHFEAASRLDPDEKEMLKNLLDGMLLKHEAKKLFTAR